MRDEINPYRIGVGLVVRKLRWDLYLDSHLSRNRLSAVRGKHLGKKAIILCNGPSLNKVDFRSLEGTFCIGLNKINLLFDRSSFRPDCICAVNPYVIEQNASFFNETDLPLYLDSYARRAKVIQSRPNVTYLFSGPRGFARDCSLSVYQGHTVTYVALQLAFHMGFSEVGLIGCDHSFSTKGPANKLVEAGDTDPNHFDPRYFSNMSWQLPDLAESEASYAMARRVYEEAGRKIYNCTDGGNLDMLPRLSLSEFLNS